MKEPEHSKIKSLRAFIEKLINKRLESKIEKENKELNKAKSQEDKDKIENKIRKLIAEHQREAFLAKAAKEAKYINFATHIPKFTHSSASGASSICFQQRTVPHDFIVNTDAIKGITVDVGVNNSTGLYISSFLSNSFEGETLIEMVSRRAPELAHAMSDDIDLANEWMDKFSKIKEPLFPSSDNLMKQVYFPLKDGSYHLVSPVFPTSLVHEVHETVKSKRFSDTAAAARKARKDNLMHETGYMDFYDLAYVYYGGAQPQNVSQLNSSRRGAGVLFASVPPNWRSKSLSSVNSESVFHNRFAYRPFVKELLNEIHELAKSNYNNFHIREGVKNLVKAMSYELADLSYEMLELPAGWSKNPECRLNYYEKLWLDPFSDAEGSREAYLSGKWCGEVAKRFARWLTKQIKDKNKDAVITDPDVWSEIAEYVLDDVRRGNRDEQ